MNEQIKQLAEQARKYARENETHWSANAEREELFEQKFAELIVGECMEQVWYTREEMFDDTIIRNIRARMAKHFGVEEK